MTERDWLTCRDPIPMLEALRGVASARKLRLFAVACLRRMDCWFKPGRAPASYPTADLAERYAEGEASEEALKRARDEKEQVMDAAWPEWPDLAVLHADPLEAATRCARGMVEPHAESGPDGQAQAERDRRAQAALVREIFGDPLRPVHFEARWRTANVTNLVRELYSFPPGHRSRLPEVSQARLRAEEAARWFDVLPRLWEALQDAGCNDPEIRAHCWSREPHVRGCWVVDLCLGKE
jgi:hypothetical protein